MSKLSEKDNDNFVASLMAAVIKNNTKDFNSKYLSDEQSEELIHIIRNYIYTVLVNMRKKPLETFEYFRKFVPEEWEDCKLLKL